MLYRYLSLSNKVEKEKEPWKWEVVGYITLSSLLAENAIL